ncbi:hypothetical protein [Luteimonas arsenica]|uniref:hypothetical protein n=1 Tax=Luteimonas arsenica TaxID=1586242 RepID=UPI0010552944|nr:hypothetical protein [Luteimonas arsenica]
MMNKVIDLAVFLALAGSLFAQDGGGRIMAPSYGDKSVEQDAAAPIVLRCTIAYDKRRNITIQEEVFLKWDNDVLQYWQEGDGWRWSGEPTVHVLTRTKISERRDVKVGDSDHSYYRMVDRTTGEYSEESWRGAFLARDVSGACAPSIEPKLPARKF